MTTIDLNSAQKLEELIKRVEAGETLRLVRGERNVALLQPLVMEEEDQAALDEFARMGLRQLAEDYSDEEFADWKPPHGSG